MRGQEPVRSEEPLRPQEVKGRGRAHHRLIGLIAVAGGLAVSTAAWAQAPWVAPPAERARKELRVSQIPVAAKLPTGGAAPA